MMESPSTSKLAKVVPYHLPPEIICEFLIRLPVRILCKLCCVSKQWYALITDPIFRASYRSRSKRNPRILLKYDSSVDHGVAVSSLDSKDRKIDPIVGFDIIKEHLRPVRVASCLDLVCLYNHESMYIWNPTTGEHMELSEEYRSRTKNFFVLQHVALGTYLKDESTLVYKLLHIQIDVRNNYYCEVLTLGGGSHDDRRCWKETNGPPPGRYNSHVAPFRGALYLVRPDRCILRFDLEREEWTSIEGPKPKDLSKRRDATTVSLKELDGSLCLADYHMYWDTAIWFLEEDHNKPRWVCRYNIDVSPLCHGIFNRVSPLLIEKDGRVLLHIQQNNTLYYYQPRTKTFEIVYVNSGQGVLSAYLYLERF